MAQAKSLAKLVRPLPKGQITLPIEFRRRLKINEKTILSVSLKGTKIEILPLRPFPEKDLLREYSDTDIVRFLKEDRISPQVAEKVRRLLGRHG